MIINPALENQNYCKDSSIAKWFINSDAIIFTSEQLTNGTSYNIQELPNYTIYWDNNSFTVYYPDTIYYQVSTENLPGDKKIVWDTNQEYIIQNIDNYSYRTVPFNSFSVTFRIRRPDGNIYVGTITRNITNSNKIFKNLVLNCGLPTCFFPASSSINVKVLFSNNTYSSNLYSINSQANGNYTVELLSFNILSGGSWQLEITDNGIISYYPITNINSINVIDIPGEEIKKIIINGNEFELIDENSINIIQFNNYKYTFNASNQSIEIITNKETNVSLVCGIDCPPNTCVKCRDGDNICCYGDNGQVIETIYDPDNLIGGCC